MNHYVIRGGVDGKKRLEVLARALWPTTSRVLAEAGLRPGLRCLDLGCGGGDVTRELAAAVGANGSVVGIDADAIKLELAQRDAIERGLANIEFRQADVYQWCEESAYDLIYCRFLLSHLHDPTHVVKQMFRAVRPGGVAIVEDLDFRGHFCYPELKAFDDYFLLYRDLVARCGGDAEIGPKLYLMFIDAGWRSVRVALADNVYVDGDGKRLSLLTLTNIANSLLDEQLATRAEIDRLLTEIERFTDDPRTMISTPRLFQVWGRRD
jgi:SAM-dependent methyltransferase